MLSLVDENTPVNGDRRAFSIKSVAEVIDASVPFVRNEIKEKRLKTIKRGARIFILSQDLDAYLKDEEK